MPHDVGRLMVTIQIFHLFKEPERVRFVAQPQITQSHYKIAMDAVSDVQIVIPNQKVGQRYGKIVYLHVVEQMLFAVFDEFVETASGLVLTS